MLRASGAHTYVASYVGTLVVLFYYVVAERPTERRHTIPNVALLHVPSLPFWGRGEDDVSFFCRQRSSFVALGAALPYY